MNWLSIKRTLSDMEIKAIEDELGIILPTDYKEVIGKINGGALRNAAIHHPMLGMFAYSRNVSLNKEAKVNIFEMIDLFNDGTIKYVPFASVGNGDYYCFDLSCNQVVLYLHESNEYLYVCATFSQLLQMIFENE